MDNSSGLDDYIMGYGRKEEGFISDSLRQTFETVNFSIMSGIISIFGCATNVINIVVFCRQKFSDSVKISLLGLAISDLGALLTLVWMSVCFNPLFRKLSLTFDPDGVQYLTAGWPHVCFARITSYITAYITLERCLCVTLPLKVKTIIIPRRTFLTILAIFLILFASVAPVYFGIGLGPVNSTIVTYITNSTRSHSIRIGGSMNIFTTDNGMSSNKFATNNSAACTPGHVRRLLQSSSTISLVYTSNGAQLENISFSISVFAQLSSFVAVIICTVILVRKLVQSSRWRARAQTVTESHVTTKTRGAMSPKDKRLVKMIIFLSIIFIVCFLPSAVNLIIMICSVEYSIVGRYRNLFLVVWSFLNCLEATNSSVNIFVYYKTNSRYRRSFRQLFKLPDKDDAEINNNVGRLTTPGLQLLKNSEIIERGGMQIHSEDKSTCLKNKKSISVTLKLERKKHVANMTDREKRSARKKWRNYKSDGPCSQYRQKHNFYLFTKHCHDLGFTSATWNFFEAGHGKGAPDGIGSSENRQQIDKLNMDRT
ncbi:hypothetical protein RRG08_028892 [Elysia crispata]|uniref:G-protein coupled receptors family 1 profile domain-containing protein n=1 Tax=Elysia crispata TaxID=231223 RepID=A0AAE1A1G6_9GAST|nr:hypothetical protein RRG08_028892 [Elysia crispata]